MIATSDLRSRGNDLNEVMGFFYDSGFTEQ